MRTHLHYPGSSSCDLRAIWLCEETTEHTVLRNVMQINAKIQTQVLLAVMWQLNISDTQQSTLSFLPSKLHAQSNCGMFNTVMLCFTITSDFFKIYLKLCIWWVAISATRWCSTVTQQNQMAGEVIMSSFWLAPKAFTCLQHIEC